MGRADYDRCVQILADIERPDDIAGALRDAARTPRIYTATHIVQFVPWSRNSGAVSDGNDLLRAIDMIDEGFDIAVRLTPLPDPARSSVPSRRGGTCCAVRTTISRSTDDPRNCPNSPSIIVSAM